MCVIGCSPLRMGRESIGKNLPGVIKFDLPADGDLEKLKQSLEKIQVPEDFVFQGYFIHMKYNLNEESLLAKAMTIQKTIREFVDGRFWRGELFAKQGTDDIITVNLVFSDKRLLKSHMFDPIWPAVTMLPYVISTEAGISKDNDDPTIKVVETDSKTKIEKLIKSHVKNKYALCIFCPESLVSQFRDINSVNLEMILIGKDWMKTPL